jgi:hypothetical protein
MQMWSDAAGVARVANMTEGLPSLYLNASTETGSDVV